MIQRFEAIGEGVAGGDLGPQTHLSLAVEAVDT